MQIFPSIGFLMIHHDPEFSPELGKDGWSAWCSHAERWVLEWDFDEGVSCQTGGEDSAPFEWRPRTWHVYAPGTRYRVHYKHLRRKHELIWILFGADGPSPPGVSGALTVLEDPEGRIAEFVRGMHRVQQAGQPGHWELLRCQMTALLAEIRCASLAGGGGSAGDPFAFFHRAEKHSPAERTLLGRFDAAVSARIHSPADTAKLASALGMSVSSLSHRLKAETGWTPVRRARWLRVQRAKKMLAAAAAGASAVKGAAAKLGFSSPCYFSRVFREETGVSPGEFVRLSRRGPPGAPP